MGAFFSNIQIRNDTEKDKFLEAFNGAMELNGFEACNEDESELSVRLLFSERFVTVLREDYTTKPEALSHDAAFFSEKLKADLFTITVVDSDFAILSLYGEGEHRDNAVIGLSDGYGVDRTDGTPELWQPLLKNGKSFNELSEIWHTDEVFVEDVLSSSAELFGIIPLNIVSNFKWADNAVTLDFCKVRQKGALKMSKRLTLNMAIKNIFGRALEPLGFKRLKGNCFIKAAGVGILQVISFSSEQAFTYRSGDNDKAFAVHGGMTTVYDRPDKIEKILCGSYRFNSLRELYSSLYPEKHGDSAFKEMDRISYTPEDGEDIKRAVKLALEYTEKILLPQFSQVTDISSYLAAQRRLLKFVRIPTPEEIHDTKELEFHSDISLLYVALPYQGDFKELILEADEFDRIAHILEKRGVHNFEFEVPYSQYCFKQCSLAEHQRRELERVLEDKELCELVKRELERRRSINIEMLSSMEINLGK